MIVGLARLASHSDVIFAHETSDMWLHRSLR